MSKNGTLKINRPHRTLTMEALEVIKDAISEGTLRPNAKLVEKQLATKLGISRTPLREALSRLEAEGYVQRSKSGGFVVIDHGIQEIRELFEHRQALEGYAAYLACQRATTKQVGILERIFDKIVEANKQGDIQKLCTLDGRFHQELYRACGNERLFGESMSLKSYFYSLRVARSMSIEEWASFMNDYQEIIHSLRNKECENTRKIMCTHLDRAVEYYISEHLEKHLKGTTSQK